MYSWSDDTSDWYGSGSYSFGDAGKDVRSAAASAAAASGPRTSGPRADQPTRS